MTDAVVVGAGITGLAAAWRIAAGGGTAVVLEADGEVGGLAASHRMDGFTIERYYHHLFAGDDTLERLLDELDLTPALTWRRASVGYRVGGRNYPLNTPLEILRFRPLSLWDKAKLARLTLAAGKITDFAALDGVLAKDWLTAQVGEKVYRTFFAPLLRAKCGGAADRVSAAWMAARIALRSHRSSSGETLAYLADGFAPFVRRWEVALSRKGTGIRTGEKVTGLIVEGGRAVGVRTSSGEVRGKAVIATVPPETLLSLHGFPPAFADACRAIPFQGTVCLAVGATRGLLPGIYWLNLDEPDLPFGLLIEHTNFFRHPAYPPAIFYLAAYVQSKDDPLLTMPEEEVSRLWLKALEGRFGLRREEVLWSRIARDAATAVVYTAGSMGRIPPMETPLPGLTWAGLAHAFPERSVNRSVELGYRAAEIALGIG